VHHHHIECPFIFDSFCVPFRRLNRKEVFIERNVDLRGKDLLRVKGVVVPKLFQDLACLAPSTSHQGVECFEIRGASRSDQVVEVRRKNLMDFDPSWEMPGRGCLTPMHTIPGMVYCLV
jgi:hypothetical protein